MRMKELCCYCLILYILRKLSTDHMDHVGDLVLRLFPDFSKCKTAVAGAVECPVNINMLYQNHKLHNHHLSLELSKFFNAIYS